MNKNLKYLLIMVILIFFLPGCKEKHIHDFSVMEEKAEYLAFEVECESKPLYYYHCACGEKGTSIFEGKEVINHDYHITKKEEPTYFTYGVEIKTCSRCNKDKETYLQQIPFPDTNYPTDELEYYKDGITYTIKGIIVDEKEMAFKTQQGIVIYLNQSLIPNDILIKNNDFIVIRGIIQLTNTNISIEDYKMLQHNDTVYTVLEAIYKETISSFSGGKYQTGNYGSLYNDGYEFVYIRTIENTILSPKNYRYEALPGTFQNRTGFGDIESIELTYQSNSIFRVGYSEDYVDYEYITIPKSDYQTTIHLELKGSDYFKIETIDDDILLFEIIINYCIQGYRDFAKRNVGENRGRINLKPYEGDLIPGVSQVTYPIDVTYYDDHYEVNKTKTYTYYTIEYIQSNIDKIYDAIMIEPRDVINYYIAFHKFPVNYSKSKTYKEIYPIFTFNARQYSTYSRTDGYVQSIPFKGGSYHEFDIDLDGTYVSETGKVNRGVGRVVIFENGFDVPGYNEVCVAVYTDTHYLTFQEYYNDGSFSTRFNAEGVYSAYYYGAPKVYEMVN